MKSIMNKLQAIVEKCDSLESISFWHSVGGGTGSGLFSLFVEELEACSKFDKLELMTYPSVVKSPGIVEPYNSILSQHYTIDAMDVSLMFDNETMYKVFEEHLHVRSPTHTHINKMISQMYNSITASARFPGTVGNLKELSHNLIPFPRIHFPIPSLSPLATLETMKYVINTVDNITINGLFSDLQLVNSKPSEGSYISCCLIYRGNVNPTEAHKAVQNVKSNDKLNFVDWCPVGIKMIYCDRPAYVNFDGEVGIAPISLGILSNNSSITDIIITNTYKFQFLFRKRAFVHWYIGEGQEESEFNDAMENVVCLISDYESLTNDNMFLNDELGSEKYISALCLGRCASKTPNNTEEDEGLLKDKKEKEDSAHTIPILPAVSYCSVHSGQRAVLHIEETNPPTGVAIGICTCHLSPAADHEKTEPQ